MPKHAYAIYCGEMSTRRNSVANIQNASAYEDRGVDIN